MQFFTHIPQPPLGNFVELFWFYDGYFAGSHKKERLMPDGSVELIINLKEDEARIYDRENLDKCERLPGTLLCGPHSNCFVIDTDQQQSVIGIHFKPGGAFPFFKMPASELHNLHISLEDLWGHKARLLRERLLEARTPQIKFQVLEECLLEHAFRPLERHRAVDHALALFRNIHTAPAMTDLADHIGISSRRFIQLFSSEVGLTRPNSLLASGAFRASCCSYRTRARLTGPIWPRAAAILIKRILSTISKTFPASIPRLTWREKPST